MHCSFVFFLSFLVFFLVLFVCLFVFETLHRCGPESKVVKNVSAIVNCCYTVWLVGVRALEVCKTSMLL